MRLDYLRRWGIKVEDWAGQMLSMLTDRGVVEVKGADAGAFLQRLITNSVLDIPEGESRYAALLTPQGKILFDFFVVPLPQAPGYFLDCFKEQAGELIKRLNLHKLRANVAIADKSEELGVAAIWDDAPGSIDGAIFRDMRTKAMGLRAIAKHDVLRGIADVPEAAYEAHRIRQGAPKGGADFAYGETFVHEANLDLLNGVDFKKGCYVGQEVIARVEFRKSARRRIAKIRFDGEAPAHGTPIVAGDVAIGQAGSAMPGEGLAMIRLDRLEDAQASGTVLRAGNLPVKICAPAAKETHGEK